MKAIKIKSSGVSLHFELQDSEGQRMPRVFSALPDKLTVVPAFYAGSFFNSNAIKDWVREGSLIIVEGKEELEAKAIEESYINEPIVPVNQAELVNVLKGNNLTKIKDLFEGENKKVALDLAAEHAGEISQNVLLYIEKETGISLLDD